MRKTCWLLPCSLALGFMLSGPLSSAGEASDSLWEAAVCLWEANDDWVPGSVYMHMQEVDKNGAPKDEKGREMWSRLYLDEEGEVDFEIIKVLDDGEDITEKEKAEEEKKAKEEQEKEETEGKGEDDGEDEEEDEEERVHVRGYMPFERDEQSEITVTPAGTHEVIDGRRCAIFDFEHARQREDGKEGEKEKVIGRVWIDAAAGIPLKMEYTTDPLPKRVKKMKTTMLYECAGPGSWYARSMSLSATGGILFINKHFQMDMTFSDYWRMPEDEPDSAAAGGDEAEARVEPGPE